MTVDGNAQFTVDCGGPFPGLSRLAGVSNLPFLQLVGSLVFRCPHAIPFSCAVILTPLSHLRAFFFKDFSQLPCPLREHSCFYFLPPLHALNLLTVLSIVLLNSPFISCKLLSLGDIAVELVIWGDFCLRSMTQCFWQPTFA
jgi:hypothetical protein